ncbi:MAG: hybrid sensor histidine kinase/response regulator [Cyanobacteriota bacterium]|nr:hybrid sensor histidine kinase/response regulator [Cyanobacteriota bacterium]
MSNYILAVDDNPDNLFLVQLALEQEGHEIALVDSGAAALAQIEKSHPDLILLDVMMPGMDGYEVARRLRGNPRLPFIPILMITAHDQSSVVAGLDAGADEFIRKPVKVDELQARVRSLLRLKQSIDRQENFVHCLTHDLRTPLVAADRMLGLIQQGVFGEVSGEMDRAIATISSSNQNLLSMLNTLLEVYCYDAGKKVFSFIDFNLPELLEEVTRELSPLAKDKGIELRAEVGAEIGEIRGDRLELRRILTNLIGNAIKFTDSGFVELRAHSDGNKLVVEVEDTGIGISAEDKAKLFDRFRQGNHLRSGSGLGLYLCHQIIQSHRGTIDVTSEVGKGTLFTICLPMESVNKKQ